MTIWARCAIGAPFISTANGSPMSRRTLPSVGSATAAAFRLPAVEAVEKAHRDPRADEMRDVAAERADLLDEARGDELKAVGGHQEHGLDPRVEPGIHAGHLELVFEIGHGPHRDPTGRIRLT